MSIAGVRSNRGDGYQTLVGFDWALSVLSEPDFQWIEIDSIKYKVDDMVVGKIDGTLICCQCKKNQPDFNSWRITELADELRKASSLLAINQFAEVHFYSRSPFGEIAKLREYCITQDDEASYQSNMSKELKVVDTKLRELIEAQTPHLSTFRFLRRIMFETSPDMGRMEELLRVHLNRMVSNPGAAYNAIWTCLDKLGARMVTPAAARHRLTKDDLKKVLCQAGSMLAPFIDIKEVFTSFASISAIGRSWQCCIAGQIIPRPILDELLEAIDAKKKTILLTGLPGSGKTCVILALQEILERRAQTRDDLVPLFIQAREFANLVSAQEREAQGLPEKWVEKAARIAENKHVVVVIDSLDVLSIARDHRILSYFLAQIDRLLIVPNITVITACRDFDRHYDRRISERRWDFERKCLPLNWDSEIAPILAMFDIDISTIDDVTRELIRNPRELSLFVELAQREGSFNVVTSQSLAQRYLDTIVVADNTLGEPAMRALETIANEMLVSRRLTVPHQRFSALPETRRLLCSLNVLQETRDGNLTFGHQTLLDVLVISRAVHQGINLMGFIQGLSPVPFVRPSIRSFINLLIMGDRRDFRSQLRTVLTSSVAFHIRRLIAESLAEQRPQDDDWSLIRDLRKYHYEVFQVIYTRSELVDWHYFWFRHLVPALKNEQDSEALIMHAYRVSRWIPEDTAGVLDFWTELMELDWVDEKRIAMVITRNLTKIDTANLALAVPLIKQLLRMPRQESSLLGRTIARYVVVGMLKDTWLWHYIAGDISDEDVLKYRFDKKLHCQSYEFGDRHDKFLLQRMEQSTLLLDLAIDSIEGWSQIKSSHYGYTHENYYSGFIQDTSYRKVDSRREDSVNILLDAMESAILHHAKTHSDWWQDRCERLAFSREGALRYYIILSCTYNPESNIDLIRRMLCDKDYLESDLSYELGTLIQAAFIYLDIPTQDVVMAHILTSWEEYFTDERYCLEILKERASLVLCIPCYLRSPEVQTILDLYEKTEGFLIRHPKVKTIGGVVTAPFSYQVFLSASDSGVLRLLAHYSGYKRDFVDFHIGGEEEVGGQLREASYRHPTRFLYLLSTNWADISEKFADAILEGVSNCLMHKDGHLNSNDKGELLEEPDGPALASNILDELERHINHWWRNRVTSRALGACANVIEDLEDADRFVRLAMGYTSLREEITVEGDSVDLIEIGFNMMSGNVAEALMILAIKFQQDNTPFPELLSPTLFRFAGSEYPAVRAMILRHLPFLQRQDSALGWDIFDIAMRDATGLWEIAEPCLYHSYYKHFEIVAPLLSRIKSEGSGKALETWGRISALSVLAGHIDIQVLFEELKQLKSSDAWKGAAVVWAHHENIKNYREQCLIGLEIGLSADFTNAKVVADEMKGYFFDNKSAASLPIALIELFFAVLVRKDENEHHDLDGYSNWLNAISRDEPDIALAATEHYLAYIRSTRLPLDDFNNNLVQLMTRLFTEAEEIEESDNGNMLNRVVSVQDMLLSLGVEGVDDWLKAAERP